MYLPSIEFVRKQNKEREKRSCFYLSTIRSDLQEDKKQINFFTLDLFIQQQDGKPDGKRHAEWNFTIRK